MGNNPEELLKTAEQEEYHHLVNRVKPKPHCSKTVFGLLWWAV